MQLAYVDQSRDALDGSKTVWEEISEGLDQLKVGERVVNSRQYMAGFNFKGTDQQARIGNLSGGERNRVHLAKLLRSGGNLLLLDEPTNDLDVDTLRALEQALLAFPGCADDHLPRPLVPRPRRHPRAGLRGRLAGDAGSRATSRPTRSTAARCSAPRPTGRIASPTSDWPVAERVAGAAGAAQPEGAREQAAGAGAEESPDSARSSATQRLRPLTTAAARIPPAKPSAPRCRPTGAPGAARTAATSPRCSCARWSRRSPSQRARRAR